VNTPTTETVDTTTTNTVDATASGSTAERRKADESEPVTGETRESLIASVTAPANFDESTATKVEFPAEKYPDVDLVQFIAGYKNYFVENYPGCILYAVTAAQGTNPYVLVSGENVDAVVNYLNYYFNNDEYFQQALEYSRNVVDSLPSAASLTTGAPKKRSRFDTADDDTVVQLPSAVSQASGYGMGSVTDSHAPMSGAALTETIYIPEDKVGLIIGRKGDTINMLQTICGAKVTITRESNVDPRGRPVTISGNSSQIAHCQREINRLIDNAQSNPEPGVNESMPHEKLHISNEVVGILIGRAGETVRIIQMKSGCTVHIQKDIEVQDPSKGREITIYGEPHQREMAKAEINKLVKAAEGQSAIDTAELLIGRSKIRSVQMSVANHMVGLIIGRSGENIKNIQQQTGAKIQIDKDTGAPQRNMTISAPSEQQVAHARQLVEQIMQRPHPSQRFGGQGYGQQPAYGMPAHGGAYGQAPAYGAAYGQAGMAAPYGGYPVAQDPYAAGAYQAHAYSQVPAAGAMPTYGQQPAASAYPAGQAGQAGAAGAYSQGAQPQPGAGQDKASMRAYYVDYYMKQGYTREQSESYADYYVNNPQ